LTPTYKTTELIPDMIEWRQGYQVVYAQRTNAARRDGSSVSPLMGFIAYWHLADVDIPPILVISVF